MARESTPKGTNFNKERVVPFTSTSTWGEINSEISESGKQ